MMGLAVIVGTVIACNSLELMLHNIVGVMWGFLTAFALTAASMVINDVFDVNVDKVNAPWRPIPSGRMSLITAKAYFLALCIIGLLASYFINPLALLVAFISIIISYTYSAWGKRTGLLGNAMVSLCVAIPFIYGSIIIYNSIIPITLIFFTIAFLANMGREVTKGMVDVEGDKLRGIKTVALVYGLSKAALVSIIFYLSAVALSILPIILRLVSIYYIPFIIITDIGFIYSSIKLIKNPSKENAYTVKKMVLIWMLTGMLAFLAGRIVL